MGGKGEEEEEEEGGTVFDDDDRGTSSDDYYSEDEGYSVSVLDVSHGATDAGSALSSSIQHDTAETPNDVDLILNQVRAPAACLVWFGAPDA